VIEVLEETGSTNADLLARLAANDRVSEGDWLIAKRQSAGRGRQGRTWFDGFGNFMGSSAVHTSAEQPAAHTLALVAAIAVYETVIPFLPEPGALQLKWPNDLLLRGAKLAGILLERSGDTVVVGIGVNLRISPELPDRQTTALAHVTAPPKVKDFAKSLAHNFEQEAGRWRTFGLEPLIRRWLAASHPVGTPISVHDPAGETMLGTFDGLDANGSLQLCLPDGSKKTVHAGDIVLA
jgi:BirA family biotin operon repressor/biotin-[acetyl-CoA-carboxylase] ligase